jgi:hypothetical protein
MNLDTAMNIPDADSPRVLPVTGPLAPVPWYRQFWPWFVISLPASAVVAGLTTVWIAFENRHDLVQDSWYKDGVAINQHLERQQRAIDLGIRLSLQLDRDAGRASAFLEGRALQPPPLLSLTLLHPTLPARDTVMTLALMPDGHYAATTGAIREGRYRAQLSAPGGDWQLDGDIDIRGPRADFVIGTR